MMRGFQIWPQISNRIKFGLFLAKKTVGNWQHTQFSPFCFFLPKRGPILSDLNSEIRFGILGSFCIFSAYIWHDFRFLIFWPTMHFQKFDIKFATPKSAWNRFFHAPLKSACLKPRETTRPPFNFQSWCFSNNPNPKPALIRQLYGTCHPLCCLLCLWLVLSYMAASFILYTVHFYIFHQCA